MFENRTLRMELHQWNSKNRTSTDQQLFILNVFMLYIGRAHEKTTQLGRVANNVFKLLSLLLA